MTLLWFLVVWAMVMVTIHYFRSTDSKKGKR